MERSRISVVIPIYNSEKYLGACLASVLSQTFKNFEIICVNDGSTDTSADILEAFRRQDTRINVYTQSNQGLSMARNNGVKKSNGEYVYFLDSDDTLHPQALEILYYLITKNDADLAVHDLLRVQESPKQVPIYDYKKETVCIDKDALKRIGRKSKYHFPINAFKLYKRELITNLPFIPCIYFEDFPFTICLLKNKPKAVITSLPLYFYMENNQSITHSNWTVKKMTDYCIGIDKIIEYYQNSPNQLKYISRHIFPKYIKQAFNSIFRHIEKEEDLTEILLRYRAFFIRLQKDRLMSWKGHKLKRYFAYKKLMKAKNVQDVIPLMRKIFK